MKFLNHALRCSTPSQATSSTQHDGAPSERVQTGSSAYTTGLSSTPPDQQDDIVLVQREFRHLDDQIKTDLPDECIGPILESLPLSWRKIFLKGKFDNFQDFVKLLI